MMSFHQDSGLERSICLHLDRLHTTVERTSQMTDIVLFPRKWLRILFRMWLSITRASLLERAVEKQQEFEETIQALELQVQDLQGQVEVLQEQIEPEKSIWRMKKDPLVEVAVRELGMTRVEAMKYDMHSLRERIKRARDMLKTTEDPLAKKPVGFSNMTHAELVRQMEKRNLPMPPGRNGAHRANTRGFMKVAIEDDIERRLIQSGR